MLSGIGPAEHLIEMGIDVPRRRRGVGGNLSDHPVLPVIWSTPRIRGLWEKAGNANLLRWQLTHRGPLTSNVAESGGFATPSPGCPRRTCSCTCCPRRTATRASTTRPSAP
jgi:choline dehydrogenase